MFSYMIHDQARLQMFSYMIHDQARLQMFNYMIHDQARLQMFNYMIHDQDHDHSTIEAVPRPQSVSLGHHVTNRVRRTDGVDRCRSSVGDFSVVTLA